MLVKEFDDLIDYHKLRGYLFRAIDYKKDLLLFISDVIPENPLEVKGGFINGFHFIKRNILGSSKVFSSCLLLCEVLFEYFLQFIQTL